MYLTKKKYWPILLIIDLFGNILFFWKRFKSQPSRPKKILFIRLEHIGDMIMSTPVFETWKKNNPDCEVHVLCRTLTEPLIKNNPNVDKIIVFDSEWMLKRQDDKKQDKSKIIKVLQKEKYDIVFEMHGDPRNIMLANKLRTYTIGYSCRGLGFLLNKIIEYESDKQMIKQNLELIRPFCKDIYETTKIYSDNKANNDCSKLMKKYRLIKGKFIIINPKSGRAEKDLTNDEVWQSIKKYPTFKIIITGSQSERPNNDQYAKKNIINICGQTDLLALAELVKNAKLVIGPDTGIMHIAKAAGTTFKCIYKTTNSKVWGYD
ncbi:TPA: glycosyltransferase family 9 protein [Candidatus Woesearchaeota archaeon]|nr:glycosyltransferase family 9 protein [Candidatus Woesearchaeota archaeon]